MLIIMQLLFTPLQLTQSEQIKQDIVIELVKSHLDVNHNGIVELSEALTLLQKKKSFSDYVDIDLLLTVIGMYLGVDLTKRGAMKGLAKLTKKKEVLKNE